MRWQWHRAPPPTAPEAEATQTSHRRARLSGMAHGNVSDLAFLLLLIGAIITWAKPELLFEPSFPSDDAAVGALVTLSGGLALQLGLTYSGVKWNPINGKMGGFGGFCAVVNAVLLGNSTGQNFFYAFAAALALASVHIFLFPSNPPVPKGPENKDNHGNASDLVCLLLFVGAMACIFKPDLYFQDIGPVKASFEAEHPHRPELEAMISYCGGLLLTVSMILSGVKWNPVNGKMAGLGCFVSAGLALYVGAGTFFFYNAAVILLGGVHVFFFPSNPLPAKKAAP